MTPRATPPHIPFREHISRGRGTAVKVLAELVTDINNVGGVVRLKDGNYALACDEEWIDLAWTAVHAHEYLEQCLDRNPYRLKGVRRPHQ